MTLDFENFSVEIDAEATRQAYEGVHRVGEGCDNLTDRKSVV